MKQVREELTKEIAKKFPWLPIHGEDRIAAFILADRKQVVQGYKDIYGVVGLLGKPNAMEQGILETCEKYLKNAGLE